MPPAKKTAAKTAKKATKAVAKTAAAKRARTADRARAAKPAPAKKAPPAKKVAARSIPQVPGSSPGRPTTVETELELVQVPIAKLHASKANPRTTFGDLNELVASIREVGILQALLVTADADGYEILAGERRYRAAKLAGLTKVPCTVRAKIEAQPRLVSALIENIQREDLPPIDEAKAFSDLIEKHGLTQQQVADRLGVSAGYVSKRLALLKLPPAARKLVGTDDLSLATAYELSRLADDPKRITEVLKVDGSARQRELEYQIAEHERAQAAAALRAELEKKGVKVIDRPSATARDRAPKAGEPIRIMERGYYSSQSSIDVDMAKHRKEPCRAVAVIPADHWARNGKPTIEEYCTDMLRHAPAGDSDLKAAKPSTSTSSSSRASKKSDKERARAKAERAAHRDRDTFMMQLVGEAGTTRRASRSLVTELALRRYATSGWSSEAKRMVALLGIEPLISSGYGGRKTKDWSGTLEKYLADGNDDHIMRAALARAFAEGEERRRDSHRQLLMSLGYEPAEIEREEWAQAELDQARQAAEYALGDYEDACRERKLDPIPSALSWQDELDSVDLPAARAREIEQQARGLLEALTAPARGLEDGGSEAGDFRSAADPASPASDSADGTSTAAPLHPEGSAAPAFTDRTGPDVASTLDLGQFPAETVELLTEYVVPASSSYEEKCRDAIAECEPTVARIIEIQQELYAANPLGVPRADQLARELKVLARRHPKVTVDA